MSEKLVPVLLYTIKKCKWFLLVVKYESLSVNGRFTVLFNIIFAKLVTFKIGIASSSRYILHRLKINAMSCGS